MLRQNYAPLTISEILGYLYQLVAQGIIDEGNKEYQHVLLNEINNTKSIIELCSLLEQWIINSNFLPDAYCINKIIMKLGAFGEKAFAEDWFEYSKHCKYISAADYNVMIAIYGDYYELTSAFDIYEEAKAKKLINKATFLNLIKAAVKCKSINHAVHAYNEAYATRNFDEKIRNCMLVAFGACGNLLSAKEIYESIELDNRTSFDYNAMITAAGDNEDLAYAKGVFILARSKNKIDRVTYNAMISASGKNQDIYFATDVFNEAVQLKKADRETYNTLIQAAGKNKNFTLAKETFEKALAEHRLIGNFIDSYTINNIIAAAVKCTEYDEAKRIFYSQEYKRYIDKVTYVTMIVAAGKHSDLEEAKKLYERAKSLHYSYTKLHNAMINTAGKNKDYEFALSIYSEIADTGYADLITYQTMLDVACFNDEFNFARQLFTYIKENYSSPMESFQIYIDFLFKNDRDEEAQQIYSDYCDLSLDVYNQYDSTQNTIDLHFQSYATTYLGLRKLITQKQLGEQDKVVLIVGKGIHSEIFSESGLHPVREAVGKVAELFKLNFSIQPDNPGRIELSLTETPVSSEKSGENLSISLSRMSLFHYSDSAANSGTQLKDDKLDNNKNINNK